MMLAAARLLKVLIRVCGAGAMLLGLAFWAGYWQSLLPVHTVLGIGLVLGLAAVAAVAWRMGVRPGLAAVVAVFAVAVPWLGQVQTMLLPGPQHWMIRLLHLVVGATATGLGGVLASAVEQRASTASAV